MKTTENKKTNIKEVLIFLENNSFKKVGDFDRVFSLDYYKNYNLTFCNDFKVFYLTKYTKKYARFLYQKKLNSFEELKKYLKENVLI